MKPHGMYYSTEERPGVFCTCGQFKKHRRGAPLARWARKHTEKTGHGWITQGE